MMTNKELIKNYPFIAIRGWNGKTYRDGTSLDLIPKGWKKAFGEAMCEDFKKALKADGVKPSRAYVLEAKEKWGFLRWDMNYCGEHVRKVQDDYERLSGCVCINCGKIGVPMTDFGWISPLCEDCYDDNIIPCEKPYKDIIVNQYEIPENLKERFKDGV